MRMRRGSRSNIKSTRKQVLTLSVTGLLILIQETKTKNAWV